MFLVAPPRPAGRAARWLSTVALTAALAAGSVIAVAPSAAHAADPVSYTGIVLGVGSDETQRTLAWYTSSDSAQVVQVAPTASLVNGEFGPSVTTFSATGAANIATSGGYNRHAVVSGLQENTQYSYRVGSAGNWSTTYSFKTQSFEGDFDFLFFGDPQIGASGNTAQDGAGWADTLNVALNANPNAELLVSGGDQVEAANTESQWDAFLAPDQLRQYPWAATIGNHDVGGKAYEQHFHTPNTDYSDAYYAKAAQKSTTSGGDYWYIYKDVLFIDLNSNSYDSATGGGDQAHVQYVTDVVNAHGADAKYKVLTYHHSIYSAAAHAKDKDAKVRRVDFPTVFSDLGVDLVLQGHDHVYTRSYEINDGAKANADEVPGQNEVFVGEGGVIYMTANSASGSKYYDISAPDATGTSGAGNGGDPLNPANYWYNSVQNQEHVRSYVKVQVKADELVVEGIRSGTCDSTVEGGQSSWCGTAGSSTAVDGVGSVIDSVTIHPFHGNSEEIQVTVPTAAPGEFGWTIDGQNGLVDLGTAQESKGSLVANGEINPINVSDSRSSHAPWSLTAVVSDFSDGGKTFSGSYLGWTPKVLIPGAGAVAGAPVASGYFGGSGLSVSRALGSAANGHEKGSALLGAGLDLKLPAGTEKGSYRATLTVTALAG
ncbi:metallophosphoesterase family protein [Arthrobacter sp. zg-Y20]|uniref:purple acid phosphatase family protein n=1 Tax=unclassified Arthrobacter TaxID=235627 RepID=UPI001D132D94|nr:MULTISPECIES: metallophosphoesterase family protein [unclassified Arthrobacter]MCC3276206.1 metallophosphoesterase family protein [Arthrobacter sp. zg-Y20]MDK1316366.1 metallophosphoesterase family protein [Arthrobacter sp. zg.Y20]WIB06413.1 metallophosphoesterase family protein [Arthrobacter sp. zg-Y20]